MSAGYSGGLQGEASLGEAAFDEAWPALDCPQAVPEDPDEVAEGGAGEVGQGAPLESPRVLWRLPIHGRVGRWEQHGSTRTSCVTGRSGWCWTWSRTRRPA